MKWSFVGVWVYSGARKRSKWRNAVSCASEPKHLWKRAGCYDECQNVSRLQRKTPKDIFWRVFIISGLYFASRTFSYKVTKTSRVLWPPNSSQRQLGGQLFSLFKKIGSVLCERWWQWSFFVHIVTIVGNAETLVASFFGLHFRCDWFIWPDHHSNAV